MRESELRVHIIEMKAGIARIEEQVKANDKYTDNIAIAYGKHRDDPDAHGIGQVKWMFRVIIGLAGLSIAVFSFLIKVLPSLAAGG